jgi:hypothetical protein
LVLGVLNLLGFTTSIIVTTAAATITQDMVLWQAVNQKILPMGYESSYL